jgi:hypothetical protein
MNAGGFALRLASPLTRNLTAIAAASLIALTTSAASAALFDTTESSQYLIVARDRVTGNTDVSTSNFELGANKAPVPSTDSFLDGGSSGGPTLLNNVPALPPNAAPVGQGIGGHGNIAVTDALGTFNLQNVGVYADPSIGIRVAAPNDSFNASSNAFFNDPNQYPNTFDTNTQTGNTVNPNDADQNTRIDPTGGGHPSNNVGVTYSYNHAALLSELSSAQSAINPLSPTATLNVSGNGGKIENTNYTFTASSGLNVIDIITGGNDFLISNANFVIDGPDDASVIFRLLDGDNMLISNGNVLRGNSGILDGNILFYTDQDENDTHFSFSNTILNGVAFWSLSDTGGSINLSNAQGCTQLVADIILLSNVRLNNCPAVIPEPASLTLLFAGAALTLLRQRSFRPVNIL